jgi:hypothetical protein
MRSSINLDRVIILTTSDVRNPTFWKSRVSVSSRDDRFRLHSSIWVHGKEISLLALLEQHLDLMPMTGDYLSTVMESIEDFQIRRIRWAIGELDRRREPMVCWRVMKLAGLGGNISDLVRDILEKRIQ